MISKKLEKALNNQIKMEGNASQYYLAMATWADGKGFGGVAKFFYAQSEEERHHMLKIVHFMAEMDATPLIPAVAVPKPDYKSLTELFKTMLSQECKVSASINALLALATKESENNTINLLEWFVEEQREEEKQARDILDLISMMGIGNSLKGHMGLFHLDQEMEKRAAAHEGAQ